MTFYSSIQRKTFTISGVSLVLLHQIHNAFTEHKIYEYPAIKRAAADPDFLSNIAIADILVKKVLEKNTANEEIAIKLKDHAAKWNMKQTYEWGASMSRRKKNKRANRSVHCIHRYQSKITSVIIQAFHDHHSSQTASNSGAHNRFGDITKTFQSIMENHQQMGGKTAHAIEPI